MAEEQNAENTEKKKSSIIMTAALFLAALLVPASIGLGLFKFFVMPKLAMNDTVMAAPPDDIPAFPETMTTVVFDELLVTVQSDDPDLASPLLQIKVALSCADEMTSGTVEGKKEYFAAEILRLHQGRTRSELNDPLVQNSILEQIKQQSNILLKKLSPRMELKVLKAMYLKFTIMEL